MALLKPKQLSWVDLLLFSIVLVYAMLKANAHGDAINVFLNASTLLFEHKNIYAASDLGTYDASPLFACLLYPLSLIPITIARVLWAIGNALLFFRLWILCKEILLANIRYSQRFATVFTIILLVLSFDAFNNNLIIGQITLLILWLTIEGLQQILLKRRLVIGSCWLALGINIKILPILALVYLLLKQRFRAVAICTIFLIAFLILPSLFIGHQYNSELLGHWQEKIPFVHANNTFSQDNAQHSLNNILPAYFYDFANVEDNNLAGFKRKITFLSEHTVFIIVQTSRILVLLSFLLLIFYRESKRKTTAALYFWWEIAYLALLTFLVFPNQPRYALFYYFPTGAYLLLFIFLLVVNSNNSPVKLKLVAVLAGCSLLLLASMGRDLMGSYLISLLDFYHIPSLLFILGLLCLLFLRPDKLLALQNDAS